MTGPREGLWRWPLWSWGHLAFTALVLAGLLFAAGRIQAWGSDSSSETDAAPTPLMGVAEQSQPSLRASQVPTSFSPAPSTILVGASEGPQDRALLFVRDWARPYDEAANWRAKLRPVTTRAMAEQLDGVDPLRIPATMATDKGRLMSETSTHAVVRVATDNGAVLVKLLRVDGVWLVDDVSPEEVAHAGHVS